jgi:hypothetical protein
MSQLSEHQRSAHGCLSVLSEIEETPMENENPYKHRTTIEMLEELNATASIGAASPVSEVIAEVAAALSSDVEERMGEVARLKILRAARHEGKAGQKARRQLENPKLLTPYAADRAKALLAERLDLVGKINDAASPLALLLVRLELVDAELAAVQLTLSDIKADREMHAESGLYAGSAKFVSRLFSRFRIDWRDLDALRVEDEDQIAEIILRRMKPTNQGRVNL